VFHDADPSVIEHGIGIPHRDETLEFERFHRARNVLQPLLRRPRPRPLHRDQGSRAQVRLPHARDHPAAEPHVRHAARPRGHPRARPLARRRDGRDRRAARCPLYRLDRSASARASWRGSSRRPPIRCASRSSALEKHKGVLDARRRDQPARERSRPHPPERRQPAVRRGARPDRRHEVEGDRSTSSKTPPTAARTSPTCSKASSSSTAEPSMSLFLDRRRAHRVALFFDYINGFHDAANSIATVVSTRVLSPGKAVIWAAFFNFVAAFTFGTASRRPSARDDRHQGRHVRRDLRRPHRRDRLGPDHLVLRPADQLVARADRRLRRRGGRQGGLRAIVSAAGRRRSSSSSCRRSSAWSLGSAADGRDLLDLPRTPPSRVDRWFRRLQLLSAAFFSLATAPTTRRRRWASSPACCSRPATSRRSTFRSGSCSRRTRDRPRHAAGGWRIIHTMGSKITKLQPVGGFAAETGAAIALFIATHVRRAGQHDARDHRRDRRRRRDAAAVGGAVGRRRPDRLGVGADDPGVRAGE
jgi:PiT family inorganic phosphate transporter